jgi:hypothetical protein
MIPLSTIRIDGDTQPREAIDEDTVKDFRKCLDRGDEFPPVDVFQDGAAIWLADGFHRWHAADRAEHEKMECTVHKGTKADAQWFAAGVNQTHGLRRSNADKAKAVRMALGHPNAAGKSDGQIAEHVGVNDKTVAKYRAELTPEIPESTKRKGRDGRTTDTSKIGRKRVEVETKEDAGARVEPEEAAAPSVEELMAESRRNLNTLARAITGLNKAAEEADDPWLNERLDILKAHLRTAAGVVRACMGEGACTYCGSEGCERCLDSGWLPKIELTAAPEGKA